MNWESVKFVDPYLGLLQLGSPYGQLNRQLLQDDCVTWTLPPDLKVTSHLHDTKFPVILVCGGISPSADKSTSKKTTIRDERGKKKSADESKIGREIFIFNPEKNSWKYFGIMPEPRAYHAAVFTRGCVYITGGNDPTMNPCEQTSNATLRLNTRSKRWKKMADMKFHRCFHAMVSIDDSIFVFGGRDKTGSVLATAEKYNPESDEWSIVKQMPEPRMGMGCTIKDGQVWLLGGMTYPALRGGVGLPILDSVACFDPVKNVWFRKTSLREPRAFFGAATIFREVWIFGGLISVAPDTNELVSVPWVDVFKMETMQWERRQELPTPKHGFSLAKSDHRIFLFGGMSSGNSAAGRRERKKEIGKGSTIQRERLDEVLKETDMYDKARNQIIELANLPIPLVGTASVGLPVDLVSKESGGTTVSNLLRGSGMENPSPVKFTMPVIDPDHSPIKDNPGHSDRSSFRDNPGHSGRSSIRDNPGHSGRSSVRDNPGHSGRSSIRDNPGHSGYSSVRDNPGHSGRSSIRGNPGHSGYSSIMDNPGHSVRESEAATVIQSWFRGHLARREHMLHGLVDNKKVVKAAEKASRTGVGEVPGELIDVNINRQREWGRSRIRVTKAVRGYKKKWHTKEQVVIPSWPAPKILTSSSYTLRSPSTEEFESQQRKWRKHHVAFLPENDPNLGTVANLDNFFQRHKHILGLRNVDTPPFFVNELKHIRELQDETLPMIVTFGGLDPKDTQNLNVGRLILRYHPFKDRWEYFGLMPESRSHHGVAYMDGVIYISGGYNPKIRDCGEMIATKTLFGMDIRSGKWRRFADMNCSRAHHAMTALEGQLMCIGGRDHRGRTSASMELYDPRTDTWTLGDPMDEGRMGMAMTVCEDVVWMLGGAVTRSDRDPHEHFIISNVDCYEMRTKSWTARPPMRVPRAYASAVTVNYKDVWIIGGCSKAYQEKNYLESMSSLDRYDENRGEWFLKGEMVNARHCAAVIAVDNCVYMIGGMSSQEWAPLTRTELYIADDDEFYLPAEIPVAVTGIGAVKLPPLVPTFRSESISDMVRQRMGFPVHSLRNKRIVFRVIQPPQRDR